MLESRDFRELLIADVALLRGVAGARDVAMALQRFWEKRTSEDASIAGELAKLADLSEETLAGVRAEVDRLIQDALGDAHLALTRRGGLDRSIHVALSRGGARLSSALDEVGARARAPLRSLPGDRYVDFVPAGEGGMGFVYMALDTELNRLVAFKMVRPDLGSGEDGGTPATPFNLKAPERDTPASRAFEELKARFLQEAWVTGGMEHPGIVPVYELGQTTAGIPYYTMRFVRGQRTLKDAIEETAQGTVEERLRLIEPLLKLCDAVSYAHSRGVIHRDLKPENVALGEFGEVVLLDWGLAKLEGGEDLTATEWRDRIQEFRAAGNLQTVAGALGTPGYMSPEAARGQLDSVDARSDVYSLGVLLFEILTGRLPFEFRSYAEFLDCMSGGDAPPATSFDADVPSALSELCSRCLSRERTLRPSDVRSLSNSIRSWQTATAIEREVEGVLRAARAAMEGAAMLEASDLLAQVDRCAVGLERAIHLDPDNAVVHELRDKLHALREGALARRVTEGRRRVVVRGGILVLILATIASWIVSGELQRKTDDAEAARTAAVAESSRATLNAEEAYRAAVEASIEQAKAAGEAARATFQAKEATLAREATAEALSREAMYKVQAERGQAELLAELGRRKHMDGYHREALAYLYEAYRRNPDASETAMLFSHVRGLCAPVTWSLTAEESANAEAVRISTSGKWVVLIGKHAISIVSADDGSLRKRIKLREGGMTRSLEGRDLLLVWKSQEVDGLAVFDYEKLTWSNELQLGWMRNEDILSWGVDPKGETVLLGMKWRKRPVPAPVWDEQNQKWIRVLERVEPVFATRYKSRLSTWKLATGERMRLWNLAGVPVANTFRVIGPDEIHLYARDIKGRRQAWGYRYAIRGEKVVHRECSQQAVAVQVLGSGTLFGVNGSGEAWTWAIGKASPQPLFGAVDVLNDRGTESVQIGAGAVGNRVLARVGRGEVYSWTPSSRGRSLHRYRVGGDMEMEPARKVWMTADEKSAIVWDEGERLRVHSLPDGWTHAGRAAGYLTSHLELTGLGLVHVEVSSDGHLAVGLTKGGEVRVWRDWHRSKARRLIGQEAGVQGVALSPRGDRVAAAAAVEDAVYLWDPSEWDVVARVELGKQAEVVTVAFGPRGEKVIVGVRRSSSEKDRGRGSPVLRAKDGVHLFDTKVPVVTGGSARGIQFRPGHYEFLAPGADGLLYLTSLENGSLVRQYGRAGATVCGFGFLDWARAFVGYSDGQIEIYDVETGSRTGHMSLGSEIVHVVASPSGNYVAVATRGGEARMLSASPLLERSRFKLWDGLVKRLVPSSSGRELGIVLADGTALTCDVDRRDVLARYGPAARAWRGRSHFLFSPDDKHVAVNLGGAAFHIARARGEGPLRTLRGMTHSAWDQVWGPDGRWFLAGSEADGVLVWSLKPEAANSTSLAKDVARRTPYWYEEGSALLRKVGAGR